ncbi:MAG: transcriptional regulator [Anaerolineae bacterium]|nr:transcriptional regulator [Anaerolineae bacterium]
MENPFEALADLDRLIHEPARLAIMTALSACQQADFLFLQNLTGLTKGNLSTHLTRLEEAKLIEVDKQFVGKKPVTLVSLSPTGRASIDRYWERMQELRDAVNQWQADEGT